MLFIFGFKTGIFRSILSQNVYIFTLYFCSKSTLYLTKTVKTPYLTKLLTTLYHNLTNPTEFSADKDLKNFLEECKRGKIRLAKFVINKERINVNFHAPYSDKKSWADEWKENLPGCVDSYEPCFLLFRLDSIHDWALIRWVIFSQVFMPSILKVLASGFESF